MLTKLKNLSVFFFAFSATVFSATPGRAELRCDAVFPSVDFVEAKPDRSLDRPLIDVSEYRGSELSTDYLWLAQNGLLLDQRNPHLEKFDLFPPDAGPGSGAGLCASTCVVNLLGALTNKAGTLNSNFTEKAAAMVDIIVRGYADKKLNRGRLNSEQQSNEIEFLLTGKKPEIAKVDDARYGAMSQVLLEGITPLLTKLGVKISYEKIPTIKNMKMMEETDSIGFASVVLYPGADIGPVPVARHAMMILKIDTETKHIWISDPHRPNLVYKEPFFLDEKGHVSFVSRNVEYRQQAFTTYQIRAFHLIERVSPSLIPTAAD